jgi:predicted nucleic acid-binding protein
MIYLFDSNAIADLMSELPAIVSRVREKQREHVFGLSAPVDYEVRRGLLWKDAPAKYKIYLERIVTRFAYFSLTEMDWRTAAQYWASTRSAGKQLSDVDLLLAALAVRLDAVIVSNDGDFDALPVRRENWRE